MQDLLVVALDLDTLEEVYCEPSQLGRLRAQGYSGSQRLVCALCYAGQEAPAGTEVPLVVRHRVGGARRAHFAHPPGLAPASGHRPESLWHLAAKHVIARWAERQPNVADVQVERWIVDRARRADVHVRTSDGADLVFEVQSSRLTDAEWSRRHRDYEELGVTDVWLWNPDTAIHRIAGVSGLPLWQLDPFDERATLLTGKPHPRPDGWWRERDLEMYVHHSPPCSNDRHTPWRFRLDRLTLDQQGIRSPALARMRRELAEVRSEADTLRQQDDAATGPTLIDPAHRASSDSLLALLPPEAFHCVQCTALAIIRARRNTSTESSRP